MINNISWTNIITIVNSSIEILQKHTMGVIYMGFTQILVIWICVSKGDMF